MLSSASVFAEESLSVNVSPNIVQINASPEEYESGSTTISAATTSIGGYTITMKTLGVDNALTGVSDSSLKIPSFVLPEGMDSIPVAQIHNYNGYGYSVDGALNFYPIPAPTDRPVKLFHTSAPGSGEHVLTYGLNVMDTSIAAGTYTNTFQITVVANLEPCGAERICYYGNNDDGTGEMDDQIVQSNTSVDLIPSNFSRPNYGFAGWNTSMDGTGTNYGPGETITVGDLQEEGLQLYARWIPSAGSLQTWGGCSSMSAGDITALTDARDGSTYAIAKYADERCWMMENLRLDLSDPDLVLDGTNTNKPTTDFVNQVSQHPSSSNSFCELTNVGCIDSLYFNTNNINRGLTASYVANDNSSSWYSYGVDYNWYAATAGNGTYNFSTRGAMVKGDLCPKGWHLPNGHGLSGELAKLDIALGGEGKNKTENPEVSERWRKYPINYIYSGEYRGTKGYNRGISAGIAAGNAYSATSSENLWVRAAGVSMNTNSTNKNRGQPLRCIASDSQTINGNIHYDANGGAGTMADDIDVNFDIAIADANEFTKSHAEFVSWNTRADGTGTPVAAGGSVAAAAIGEGIDEGDTLTLYAIWKPVYTVSYDGNGATAGTMSVVQTADIGYLTLVSPNFSKTGYGFVGWSTDDDAASKILGGANVVMYGPNEKITIDNSFVSHADANNNVILYAIWMQADSVRTMQTFGASECANLTTGQMIALTDIRNGEAYSVTKLGDGHCWMLENLKLDPSTTQFDATNTNSPTADFIAKAASSSSSRTLCGTDDADCIDRVQYNLDNIDRSLTPSWDDLTPGYSWYSYGGMYSWYAASAGNGDYAMRSGNAAGDICPYGWRLPTGGSNGEYVALNSAIGGTLANDGALRRYPNNFIYSGDFNKTVPGGRGTYGRYWSSTAENVNKAFRLGFTGSNQGVTPAGSWNKWDAFAIRCIVK